MKLVAIPLMLLSSQSLGLHQGQQDRRVDGIVVLARDSGSMEKAERAFKYGMGFADLTVALKDAPYVVEAWGRRSAVIVDRDIGPLLRRKERNQALQVLDKGMDSEFTLDLAGLSDEDRRLLLAQAPGVMVDPNQMNAKMRVGLIAQVDFQFSGPQAGRVINEQLAGNTEAERVMNRKLDLAPFPLFRPSSKDGQERLVNTIADLENRYSSFRVSTRGISGELLDEGLEQAAKIVERLQRDLQAEQERVAKSLAQKCKLGESLPADLGNFSDLPDDRKAELKRVFGANYEFYGFDSQQSAVAFLQRATDIKVSTRLQLAFGLSPGGPGRAATGARFTFVTFPGTP